MRHRYRTFAALALGATFVVGACGGSHSENKPSASGGEVVTPVTTPNANAQVGSTPVDTAAAAKHHSKLGGAMAGAAAGHMLGGHAMMGAAAGAIIQHERNKHHH